MCFHWQYYDIISSIHNIQYNYVFCSTSMYLHIWSSIFWTVDQYQLLIFDKTLVEDCACVVIKCLVIDVKLKTITWGFSHWCNSDLSTSLWIVLWMVLLMRLFYNGFLISVNLQSVRIPWKIHDPLQYCIESFWRIHVCVCMALQSSRNQIMSFNLIDNLLVL